MSDLFDRKVTLEPLTELPEQSWDLPDNELYVQLGCSGCSNMVRFTARNVTSSVPDLSITPEDTKDLMGLIGEVNKGEYLQRAFLTTWVDPCEDGVCRDAEAIEIVAGMLNERFESSLTTPQRTE